MTSRWKKAALTSVAAAALALALPVTDANAINRVECAGRWDFVNIYSGGSRVCFANDGYLDVMIYGVSDLYSGNNDLYYYESVYGPSGPGHRHVPAWTWNSSYYNDGGRTGTVRYLQIFRPL